MLSLNVFFFLSVSALWERESKKIKWNQKVLRKLFREKIKILWETKYEFRFTKFETDSVIRFGKIFAIFFFETDYRIRFTILWNGIRIPFPTKLSIFPETAYVIRFLKVWNGCRNPFHIKLSDVFWNGMRKLFHSLRNGIRIPFHIITRKKISSTDIKALTWTEGRKYQEISRCRLLTITPFFKQPRNT